MLVKCLLRQLEEFLKVCQFPVRQVRNRVNKCPHLSKCPVVVVSNTARTNRNLHVVVDSHRGGSR